MTTSCIGAFRARAGAVIAQVLTGIVVLLSGPGCQSEMCDCFLNGLSDDGETTTVMHACWSFSTLGPLIANNGTFAPRECVAISVLDGLEQQVDCGNDSETTSEDWEPNMKARSPNGRYAVESRISYGGEFETRVERCFLIDLSQGAATELVGLGSVQFLSTSDNGEYIVAVAAPFTALTRAPTAAATPSSRYPGTEGTDRFMIWSARQSEVVTSRDIDFAADDGIVAAYVSHDAHIVAYQTGFQQFGIGVVPTRSNEIWYWNTVLDTTSRLR